MHAILNVKLINLMEPALREMNESRFPLLSKSFSKEQSLHIMEMLFLPIHFRPTKKCRKKILILWYGA